MAVLGAHTLNILTRPIRKCPTDRPTASRTLAITGLLLFSTLAVAIAPAPAAGYLVVDTTLSTGAANASLSFGLGGGTVTGPSLRLLTNSTVSYAEATLEGSTGYANGSALRIGNTGFGGAAALDNLRLLNGRLSLENTTAKVAFDASNQFGGGALSTTTVVNNRLVASTPASGGTYRTPAISNAGDGWGYFTAEGEEPGTTNVTFNLLSGANATLLANIEPGARIPFTSWEQPSLVVEVVFSASAGSDIPSVDRFMVGQRVEDAYLGAGEVRAFNAVGLQNGSVRTWLDPATWTRQGASSVVARSAATYRSGFVGQPSIIQVGSEWWMYFTASTYADYRDGDVARAVSTDLATWTVDPAPLLLNGTSGFDVYGIDKVNVIANPGGAGYLMYYTGWATGTQGTIGRASSSDGLSWTKDGQVLGVGGVWDTYSVAGPSRIFYNSSNSTWYMWYSGSSTVTGGGYSLGLATSSDGVTWNRYGTAAVMARGGAGSIDRDDAMGGKQLIIRGVPHYFYSCNAGSGIYAICLATSPNAGYSWSKVGTVFNRSGGGWDNVHVADPGFVYNDTSFTMYYSGYGGAGPEIGRATAPFAPATFTGRLDLLTGPSADLVSFTKDGSNPKITNAGNSSRSTFAGQPMVLYANGTWVMYFTAGNQSGYQGAGIGRATSADLATWTVAAQPVLRPNATMNDSYAAANPFVMLNPVGPGFLMYYTGYTAGASRHVMMATSLDGVNWTKRGDVLRPTAAAWDSYSTGQVSLVEFDQGTFQWRMWYSGSTDAGGGSSSMGLATSLDGVNWTKYGGNPVMPRAPTGAPDSADAQGGHMVKVDGWYYLYYSCNPGAVYHVCMASSGDGISWAKSGYVINVSGTAWETLQVSDGCPVISGSSFYLFYAAVGSTGYAQIARATGAFNPTAPRARMWDLPRLIERFDASATAGSGSTMSITLRSSTDGASWSSAETVTANDSTLTTPLRRYLEYAVSFTSGTTVSRLASAGVNVVAARDSGRWMDTSFSFSDPFDQIAAAGLYTGNHNISFAVSTDGGSLWRDVPFGVPLPVTGSPTSAMVEGRFRGYSAGGLELTLVSVAVRMFGLPTSVSMQAGALGTSLPVSGGTFTGPAVVLIPPSDLNAAIVAALAANASATTVDVPLLISSSHFGTLNVTAVRVEYVLKNPLTANFDPVATSAFQDENESVQYWINATTYPGAPLNYTWTVDGVTAGTAASFAYQPSFTDAGLHTLVGSVENGDFTLTYTWTVTVAHVNRPPAIHSVTPPPAQLSYRAAVPLTVTASDPDLDTLTYTWTVDGVLDPLAITNSATLTGLTEGSHTAEVTVSDGTLWVMYAFSFDLTNTPLAATPIPEGDLMEIRHNTLATFSFPATDADDDPITYTWDIDGVVQPEASSTLFVDSPAPGMHTVNVTASAGGHIVSYGWDLLSTDSGPVLTATPATDPTVSHSATQVFSVTATDAEDDPIVYAWSLDGVVQAGTLSSFSLVRPSAGQHNVTVTATAGGLSASKSWTVTSTNAAPVVGSRTPASGAGADTAAAQNFSVVATDADGDALTYAWTVNGNAMAGSGAAVTLPSGSAPGNYTVRVVVTDAAGASTNSSWTFSVPTPPPTTAVDGGSPLLLVGLLAAVAAAGVIGFMLMRRRPKGPAPEASPEGDAPKP